MGLTTGVQVGDGVIALFTRFLIRAAMTYFPQTVHHAESGLLISSIISPCCM
jgi:hypothetical protein